jgi:hypothetical protein
MPENFLPASPDYYQLTVEPVTSVPVGPEKCKLLNPENKAWVEGWLRDVWYGAQAHDFQVSVAVQNPKLGYSYSLPILSFRTERYGQTCSIEVDSQAYRGSLVRSDQDPGLSLTSVLMSDRKFGVAPEVDLLLETTAAIAVTWAGVPEPIARATASASKLAIQDWASGTRKEITKIDISAATKGAPIQLEGISLNTAAGRLHVSAIASLSPVGSALYPRPNAVPDFSRIPAEYAKTWKMGARSIVDVVDAATAKKWAVFDSQKEPAELNRICRGVQTDLMASGFSAPDAAIISWIMFQNHPDPQVRLQTPQCLTARAPELARFGVTIADTSDPRLSESP